MAWGDESGSNPRSDPNVYMMATVIAAAVEADTAREGVRDLQNGKSKLHWHGNSPKHHDMVIGRIVTLPVRGIVLSTRFAQPGEHPERQRRKAMEPLLMHLAATGCAEITLESRGPQDRNDMAMLAAMRSSRSITSALRMEHRPGPVEPILWIADAVCGAVVAARTGRPQWLEALEQSITITRLSS